MTATPPLQFTYLQWGALYSAFQAAPFQQSVLKMKRIHQPAKELTLTHDLFMHCVTHVPLTVPRHFVKIEDVQEALYLVFAEGNLSLQGIAKSLARRHWEMAERAVLEIESVLSPTGSLKQSSSFHEAYDALTSSLMSAMKNESEKSKLLEIAEDLLDPNACQLAKKAQEEAEEEVSRLQIELDALLVKRGIVMQPQLPKMKEIAAKAKAIFDRL